MKHQQSPTIRDCEWLATQRSNVTLHYSGLGTRLMGYHDPACPHVLQAPR
jgi:hypothetical protein